MTETELQAIEARANAATPGPWKVDRSRGFTVAIGPLRAYDS